VRQSNLTNGLNKHNAVLFKAEATVVNVKYFHCPMKTSKFTVKENKVMADDLIQRKIF
jgi:hypothetical protein